MTRYDPDMLLDYIEGELSPEQRAAFEQRLAADEPLRRLVEQLRADRDALRSVAPERPPRDLLEDATHRVERDMLLGEPAPPARAATRPQSPRRLHWGRTLAYTGIAAAIALSGGVILLTLTDLTMLERSTRVADVPYRSDSYERDTPAAPDQRVQPGQRDPLDEPAGLDPLAQAFEAQPEAQPEARREARLELEAEVDADVELGAAAAGQPGAAPLALDQAEQPARVEMADVGEGVTDVAAVESRIAARLRGRLLGAEGMDLDPDADAALTVETLAAADDAPVVSAREMRVLDAALGTTSHGASDTLGLVGAMEPLGPSAFDPAAVGPLRVEIATASAESTRRELMQWAVANDALVRFTDGMGEEAVAGVRLHLGGGLGEREAVRGTVEAPARRMVDTDDLAEALARANIALDAAEAGAPSRQRLLLEVRPGQVDDLVVHLNREPTRQQAVLVSSAAGQVGQVGELRAQPPTLAQARRLEPSGDAATPSPHAGAAHRAKTFDDEPAAQPAPAAAPPSTDEPADGRVDAPAARAALERRARSAREAEPVAGERARLESRADGGERSDRRRVVRLHRELAPAPALAPPAEAHAPDTESQLVEPTDVHRVTSLSWAELWDDRQQLITAVREAYAQWQWQWEVADDRAASGPAVAPVLGWRERLIADLHAAAQAHLAAERSGGTLEVVVVIDERPLAAGEAADAPRGQGTE